MLARKGRARLTRRKNKGFGETVMAVTDPHVICRVWMMDKKSEVCREHFRRNVHRTGATEQKPKRAAQHQRGRPFSFWPPDVLN